MFGLNQDKELEKAKKLFRESPRAPQKLSGMDNLDMEGIGEAFQQMTGMKFDPNLLALTQLVTQIDLGWLASLLAERPEWEKPDCFFHAALYDWARMVVVGFLQFEVMEQQFPMERLLFFTDESPDTLLAHERIKQYEALPRGEKANDLASRIPFIEDINGAPVLEDGKPKKIIPDGLILVQTPEGTIDKKTKLPKFTSNAVLLTYAFMGSAKIEVSMDGVGVDHSIFLRPAKEIEGWENIVPEREKK